MNDGLTGDYVGYVDITICRMLEYCDMPQFDPTIFSIIDLYSNGGYVP